MRNARSVNTNKHEFKLGVMFLGIALAVSAAPEFDAASVRLNHESGKRGALSFTPGRFTATALSVRSIILTAYSLKDYQLSEGPGWTTSEAYDVVGTAAGPATEAELRVMLQALLRDRFQLSVSHGQKELPVYALVVGKNGPKLKPAEGRPETRLAETGPGLTFKSTSMPAFAAYLMNLGPVDGRPVVDRTGLAGTFDFTILISDSQTSTLAPDETKKAIRAWPSLFADVQEQLGLKLEAQKAQTDFLTIDRVAKPSEN
jgi:uncharacterized protein (TIGR03435 family)